MRDFLLCLMVVMAAGVISSCEKNVDDYQSPEPVVEYHFGAVETYVSDNGVTIVSDMPRITIEDYTLERTKVKVGYQSVVDGMLSEQMFDENASKRDGRVVFKIDGLLEKTDYVARIYIEDEQLGYAGVSEDFEFTTLEHRPECALSYKLDIETRGLFATVMFEELQYTVDQQSVPIESVVFEYRRNHSTPQEWIVCECPGEQISGGRLTIDLPCEGQGYLQECCKYEYRVTVAPKDDAYTTYTSSVQYFYTQAAEVEIAVSTPQLTLEGDYLTLVVDDIDISYDGVDAEDYAYSSISDDYYIFSRRKGNEEWSREWVVATDGRIVRQYGGMSYAEPNTVLEFKVAVYAGKGTPRTFYETEVVEINVSPVE